MEKIQYVQSIEKRLCGWDIFRVFGNTVCKGGDELEEYFCKTKILSGAGAISALGQMKSKRVLIVSDPFFAKNGTAALVAAQSAGAETYIFSDVMPDPPVEQVALGTAKLKAFAPDTVVALGGGSAIDSAKALVYFAGLPVTFVAIPTTSGSGSEVTDVSILTHGGVKHPLVDASLCPDVAILDYVLLKELPKSLVADGGFDVLAHAMEAYVATGASGVTDALAKEAFSIGVQALPLSYGGNLSARQKMHSASTMAGMAFSKAGLGLCHGMSHALGGLFHLPHGRINAILLPTILEINAHAASQKYGELSRCAGFGGSADTVAVRNLKNGLIRLRKVLGIPETLAHAGVTPQQVWQNTETIVAATLNDPCCKTNPIAVEGYMVRRVLEEVTGRV